MKRLLQYDFSVMLHKKEFCVAVVSMLLFSVYAFYASIQLQQQYSWYDYNLVSAEYMTILLVIHKPWQVFTYLFAFLVVLPYSMSYLSEAEPGMLSVLLTRVTKRQYYLSKAITCFVGNAVIILIPFLLNYFFCSLLFPSNGSAGGIGEYGMDNYSAFIMGTNTVYEMKYPMIPLARLLFFHPGLYLVVHILLLSAASGAFGVFLFNLSFFVRQYRAVLFLPVFLLIRLSAALNQYCVKKAIGTPGYSYVNCSVMQYFAIGDSGSLSPWFLPILFGVILVFSAFTMYLVLTSDSMLPDDRHPTITMRRGKSDA